MLYIYIHIPCQAQVFRLAMQYGGTSYQDPANQDPSSKNSENTALRN